MKAPTRIKMVFSAVALSLTTVVLIILLLSASSTHGLQNAYILNVDSTLLPYQISRSLKAKMKTLGIEPKDVSLLQPDGIQQVIYYSDGKGGISVDVAIAENFQTPPPTEPPFRGTYLKWDSFALAFKEGATADLTTDGGAKHNEVIALGNGLEQALLEWTKSPAGSIDPSNKAGLLIGAIVLQCATIVLLLFVFSKPARHGAAVAQSNITSRGLYLVLAVCAGGGGSLATTSIAATLRTIADMKPAYVLVTEQGLGGSVRYSSSDLFLGLVCATAASAIATGLMVGFVARADNKARKFYKKLNGSNEMASQVI